MNYKIAFLLILFSFVGSYPQDRPRNYTSEDLENAAQKLHFDAQQHFRNARYWESAKSLIILVDYYPDYQLADQAVFLLGDCLCELELFESAEKIYQFVIKKYVTSPLTPRALLGLQRIEYYKGALEKSLNYWDVISRGNPPENIINLSNYYAGMANYKLKDYPQVLNVLIEANSNSPYYDYILYTLAISLLRMKKINPAVDVFTRLCNLPVTSDDRRHVIDEAHLTLGYLYYELGYFQDAITQFGFVTQSSEQRPNALLASGWASTRLEEWQQAIEPLTDLTTRYDFGDVTQEGLFLLGRCYLKLGKYEQAIKIYDFLIDIFPEKNDITTPLKYSDNIEQQQKQIEKRKMELLLLESKLADAFLFADETVSSDYIKNEQEKLALTQTDLLNNIQQERASLDKMLQQLKELEADSQTKQVQKNWRAYAEYGKSRASFLKRQRERYQQSQNSK